MLVYNATNESAILALNVQDISDDYIVKNCFPIYFMMEILYVYSKASSKNDYDKYYGRSIEF